MSVRPVAVRCETRATVRVASALRGAAGGAKMTVFPAMSSSRLCFGLPSTRGGSFGTFEAKFSDF